MALLNVIEFPDTSPSEMVHRIPEHGGGEFQLGDQLVVRESQRAVVYRDGQSLDVFGPGRHTLSTANLPLLGGLIRIPFGTSPFKVEVFFVNVRTFLDQKWGTAEPITLRDSEIGMVRLRGFGTYSMAVGDPKLFVDTIVGQRGLYDTPDIEGFLRGMIISRLTNTLGVVTKGRSFLDLPAMFNDLSAAAKAAIKDDFAAVGIEMRALYINSISPTEETQKAIDERASMGALGNMQAYLQFKAARGLGDAAANPAGGGASAGVGLGAGIGLGAGLAGMVTQAIQGGGSPSTGSGGVGGSANMGGPLPSQRGGPGGAPAAAVVTCANCGTANAYGAKFCHNCGTALSQGLVCGNCGTALPAGSKFCSNCGAKIGSKTVCPNCHADVSEGAKFCSNCGTKIP
ncbi:MAG: SPFH domain-containing protein [Chloroflexi bacterium]|nr:SPFH domain-containing protein [Chloroflexota bacterium]